MPNSLAIPHACQPGHLPHRRKVWSGLLALAGLGLTGCASLIAPQPLPRSVPIPAAWSQSALPLAGTTVQPATRAGSLVAAL